MCNVHCVLRKCYFILFYACACARTYSMHLGNLLLKHVEKYTDFPHKSIEK